MRKKGWVRGKAFFNHGDSLYRFCEQNTADGDDGHADYFVFIEGFFK